MKKKEKKQLVGIWGFGTVGKSALRFYQKQPVTIEIFDNRQLEKKEVDLIAQSGASLSNTKNLDQFLKKNEIILASPGIDLRPYKKYKKKWITELDLIYKEFKKPIIAITGTTGKTTITHILSQCLKQAGLKIWTGGNIGKGMLDLVSEKENIDCALLEVSSFQLEHCKKFAPTVAIVTNFYPNHLDRHGTIEDYLSAKKKIIERQVNGQHAIIPYEQKKLFSFSEKTPFSLTFFSKETIKDEKKCPANFLSKASSFYVSSNSVMRQPYNDGSESKKLTKFFQALPKITFKENLLVVSLALSAIEKTMNHALFLKKDFPITLPPHRLEFVTTRNGIDFYNDSKSTTQASTFAAVEKLSGKPILLLLGGLSKGINRSDLMKKIKPYIKKIYAFGAEAQTIQNASMLNKISCQTFSSLDDTITACIEDADTGDQVLLSPAGSSFDLFKNYEERGNHFKRLILQLSS